MAAQDHFHVEPASLGGYAGQVSRNAAVFDQISHYLSANASKTDQMQGLLQQMAAACAQLLSWQLGILSRMRPELADSATALTKAGNDYAHTDQRNAARLDAAYPTVKTPTGKKPI
jgi:hypothetical protein